MSSNSVLALTVISMTHVVDATNKKILLLEERLIRDGIPSRLNTPSLTEFGK